MEAPSRPIELILARNLLSSLSTPAFLVDAGGEIAFYNDSAGALLGRRFEESGPMPADEWTATFGPFDVEGQPIPFEELKLTRSLRRNRPAHARFTMRTTGGDRHMIEASALPILGTGGFQGAMVVFWPTDSDGGSSGVHEGVA